METELWSKFARPEVEAVGRALDWQSRGHGFDTRSLHHDFEGKIKWNTNGSGSHTFKLDNQQTHGCTQIPLWV